MIDRFILLQWHGMEYSPIKRLIPIIPIPMIHSCQANPQPNNQDTAKEKGKEKEREERDERRKKERKKKDIPLPTFIICSTLAYNCTFAANLHHIPLPGEAVNRSANSL
jgi:hypothetical protein